MKRRSFLASILAVGVAPAAVGSGVLMPIKVLAKPLGLPVVGRDIGFGPEVLVGYVGHWNGIRIIPSAEPMLEEAEVRRFMQENGYFKQLRQADMQRHTFFMHPEGDFFQQLKGADHA